MADTALKQLPHSICFGPCVHNKHSINVAAQTQTSPLSHHSSSYSHCRGKYRWHIVLKTKGTSAISILKWGRKNKLWAWSRQKNGRQAHIVLQSPSPRPSCLEVVCTLRVSSICAPHIRGTKLGFLGGSAMRSGFLHF